MPTKLWANDAHTLVLGPSDARWLSEEMSFLAKLYRSNAGSSERQFGGDDDVALASFWETALKCQRLSVALQARTSQTAHRGPSQLLQGREVDGVESVPLHVAGCGLICLPRRAREIGAVLNAPTEVHRSKATGGTVNG